MTGSPCCAAASDRAPLARLLRRRLASPDGWLRGASASAIFHADLSPSHDLDPSHPDLSPSLAPSSGRCRCVGAGGDAACTTDCGARPRRDPALTLTLTLATDCGADTAWRVPARFGRSFARV